MEPSNLVERARAFAVKAHEGLTRPNKANEPYAVHLVEVAALVGAASGTPDEIAAAWLHDTVEDTSTTIEEIREQFGETVADIVDGLTDKPDLAGLPTLKRKLLQAERVKEKSNSVKIVKIADQTSNLRSVAVDPPITWDEQKCRDYIQGAHEIVLACHGVSAYLFSQFALAYHAAKAAHP
jgi:guanosine-3',5'-bis(diphosphate) 3'-pyrophosphohydrolase